MANISEIKQEFLESCLNGQLEAVNALMDRGISPNTMDDQNRTALMLACTKNPNTKIIQLLLSNGANTHAVDTEGATALDYALKHKNLEAVVLLQNYPQNKETIMDYSPLEDVLTQKELETTIKICDEFKKINNQYNPFIYFKKAQALFALKNEEEGLKVLHITKEIFEETYGDSSYHQNWTQDVKKLYLEILTTQADFHRQKDDKLTQALWLYNEAYYLIDEPEQKYELRIKRNEIYNSFVKYIPQIPFHERKILYIDDELPPYQPEGIFVLMMNNLGDLQFPSTLPQKGELYVAHPFKAATYYPLENVESLFFNAQLHELTYVLQHLGAKSIQITQTKGYAERNAKNIPYIENTSMGYTNNVQEDKNYQEITAIEKGEPILHTFEPTHRPKLPANLVWYPHHEAWQNLVKQRLEGGLVKTEILLSSKNLEIVHEKDLELITEELQELLKYVYKPFFKNPEKKRASAKKEIKKDVASIISLASQKKEIFECKIKVEFAHLHEFAEEVAREAKPVPTFTEAKQPIETLKEEVKTDKPVEPNSQKQVVEKLQNDFQKMPIAQEKVVKPTIVESKTKEKPLPRPLVKDLPIIERNVVKEEKSTSYSTLKLESLSQEERYYYELLQHAYQDGVVSEETRKVLEKRRESFKISLERSEEIENLMANKKELSIK